MPDERKKLSRRGFLRASVMVATTAAIQACAKTAEPTKPGATTPTTTPKPGAAAATPKPITKYKEAPMLADLVKAGKLPPVEQRVSEEPMVVEVVEGIGQYGGTWHQVRPGPTDVSILAS